MDTTSSNENYIIMTDSSCDLPLEIVEKYNIKVLPLYLTIDDKQYRNYSDERDIKNKEIYKYLREGKLATTSAVNVGEFSDAMEEIVKAGSDILYLGFSSGLSTTSNSAAIAAGDLSEKYPERKLYVVDTLCASLGQGLIVYLAAKLKSEGKTIEEVRDYVEENKLSLCHWFTVDDLHFLKRGGRVSAATAVIGSALNIKPVMHMDNAGKLINVSKVRGRKAAIKEMFEHMKKTAISTKDVFISHGDCIDDAEMLADMVRAEYGSEIVINFVGPVIGAHSGPGTLALFFLGTER